MRIPCPHCGERDVREFTYLGDATVQRPDPQAPDALEQFTTTSICATIRPARTASSGITASGCQAWLVVTRDTRTHEISGVEPRPARTARRARDGDRPCEARRIGCRRAD